MLFKSQRLAASGLSKYLVMKKIDEMEKRLALLDSLLVPAARAQVCDGGECCQKRERGRSGMVEKEELFLTAFRVLVRLSRFFSASFVCTSFSECEMAGDLCKAVDIWGLYAMTET